MGSPARLGPKLARPVGPKHAVGPGLGRIFWPDKSNGPGLGRKKWWFTEGLARRSNGFLARRARLGQEFAARQSGRAGPRPQNTKSGFFLARPDPAQPKLMPRYNTNWAYRRTKIDYIRSTTPLIDANISIVETQRACGAEEKSVASDSQK
jgi:hypothetical protein